MRNGYFQLICGEGGTGLKIVAPSDGGESVNPRELIDYLNAYGIFYDAPALNRELQRAAGAAGGEHVFSLNQNPSAEVRENYRLIVSQDRMLATVRFYAPSLKGSRIGPEEFMRDLAFKNIVFGVRKDALDAFFKRPVYCTDITVAAGAEPRHGTDARIEYFFETDLKVKPTLNEDGSVDFFNLNTINHCNKGDVLARLYPEDKGDYGCTVYGEKIKPREVKRAAIKYGRNITLSEDRQTIVSDVDGHVALVGDKVFVSNILEIENVDNSTGNIEFEGSVKINGNVCTNFEVKAKGDIEVNGVVEGARLTAGGDIIIARGVNGMSKGELKAEGNIIAKYIENAMVTAGGYVSTESILHSEVIAGTEITVTSRKGFITGGKVAASNLIQVRNLGSSMGADTIVEVGADPTINRRLQQLQKLMAEKKRVYDTIHPVLSALTQKLSQGNKLKPEQIKNFQEMLQRENILKQEMEDCRTETEHLKESAAEAANARVEVTGEVFAGTKICIGDVSMVVKNSMSYCKFIKSQGDVKMTAL